MKKLKTYLFWIMELLKYSEKSFLSLFSPGVSGHYSMETNVSVVF
jgi:hypothetical protein